MRIQAISLKHWTNKDVLYYDKLCSNVKRSKKIVNECIKIALDAMVHMGQKARKVK